MRPISGLNTIRTQAKFYCKLVSVISNDQKRPEATRRDQKWSEVARKNMKNSNFEWVGAQQTKSKFGRKPPFECKLYTKKIAICWFWYLFGLFGKGTKSPEGSLLNSSFYLYMHSLTPTVAPQLGQRWTLSLQFWMTKGTQNDGQHNKYVMTTATMTPVPFLFWTIVTTLFLHWGHWVSVGVARSKGPTISKLRGKGSIGYLGPSLDSPLVVALVLPLFSVFSELVFEKSRVSD